MANTVTKSHPEIPLTADDWPRWQAFEQWHDRREVAWPSAGNVLQHCDRYQRFPFTRIVGASPGTYNWTWFDNLVNQCVALKQKLHFGLMSCWPDSPQGVLGAGGITLSNGATSVVPQWLWDTMNGHATLKPWVVGTYTVPNYNNPDYIDFLFDTYVAMAAHIVAIGRTNMIGCIDIRGNGSWGEWHHHPYAPNSDVLQFPSGRRPDVAALKAIIDAHKNGFPTRQLQIMLSTFDAEWLRNTYTQPEVTQYALDSSNSMGVFGWRRDNVGATDQYMKDYVEFNNRSYAGGTVFRIPIMARPNLAPVTGEPPGWNASDYFDLERQVRLHRMSSFGNGNLGEGSGANTTIANRVRAAAKASGSRIKITTSTVTFASGNLTIQTNWQNVGLAALYKYDVPKITFEVLNSVGAVVQTKTSTFNLQLFKPEDGLTAHTDVFAMSLPNGTYSVRMFVKDDNGYRDNYRLAIQGADAAFKYALGSFDASSVVIPPNPGPVVNAGGDKQIKLPVDRTTLSGTVTDDDPVNQVWTNTLRPSGAPVPTIFPTAGLNTEVSNLKAGSYTFRLTATDSEAASNFDEVKVQVLPADVVIPPDPPTTTVPTVKHVELLTKVVFTNGSSQIAPVQVSGVTVNPVTTPSGNVPTT